MSEERHEIQFLVFVSSTVFGDEKWSLDAAFGAARRSREFCHDEMACTKTLYNYVDHAMFSIKISIFFKNRAVIPRKESRENKHNPGTNIDERPEIVDLRTEFGYWEVHTVVGKKG